MEAHAERYQNNRTPVPVRFLGCGHEGRISLEKAQAAARVNGPRGLCQKCSRRAGISLRRASQEDAERRFLAYGVRLIEPFKSVTTRHRVIHQTCGQEGRARLGTLESGHPMRCIACISVALCAPEFVEEWDESNPKKPIEVPAGSRQLVSWKFRGCRHVETLPVRERVRGGQGCPVCAGKRVRHDNCLSSIHPAIAMEWHPTQNRPLTASDVTRSSGKRVWWRCSVNPKHEWAAKVNSRTSAGTGCPVCDFGRQSGIEVRLAFELMGFFSFDYEDRKVHLPGRKRAEEVDMKVASHRLIVEYDGCYYHRDCFQRDLLKTVRLGIAGWTVIRVREAPLTAISTHDVLLPPRVTVKGCANRLLQKIEEVLGITIPGLSSYLSLHEPRRAAAADVYVRRLRIRLNERR
ncbi:zinc-ribbon domain-containing protein [Archangium sp.]|uniref:zinc-ribbon domain-containing protein n=1 Tax=Archangium sp. TaxID=1872627 RepID=UPI002D7888E9|nr:zinc-ribbon domain-containing protein [Archangium sp.]